MVNKRSTSKEVRIGLHPLTPSFPAWCFCRYPSVSQFDASGGSEGVNPEDIEELFSERFRLADIADVTFDDFMQFHHNFSAAIQSDRLFEAFVRNTW